MKKIFKKTAMGIIAGLTLAGNLHADDIVLGADIWPPFNCEPGSKNPGYMVEIARKIFEQKGHKIIYKEIPWSRAINICRKGKINGIIGAAKGEAEGFVFPKEPLGKLENFAFVLKDSNWKYDGIDSLKKVKLGLIIDYDYGEKMNKYLEDNKDSKLIEKVGGTDPLRKNILKLKAKRIDAVIEAKPVFEYTVNKMGVSDLFKSAGSDGEPDPIYIAFSPNNPKSKEYAKILSDGIVEMRKSGELAKILAKYGQKDWE